MNARYIIQHCDLPEGVYVHHYLSVGGPHQGVQRSPGCFSDHFWCAIIAFLETNFALLSWFSSIVAPASYWRSTADSRKYAAYKH